jgi:hypothetical protein
MTADVNIVVEKQNYSVCYVLSVWHEAVCPFIRICEISRGSDLFSFDGWHVIFKSRKKYIPDLPSILMSFESSCHFY